MPDGIGPDFLTRNMFFREAEAGPSQQELATMMAPFQGSVEQARALYQSPEVQARMQHFGLGGFNPDMIRQSPFLPNQFMQQHPTMGGILNRGMAGAAATPEAPLVSGAGSGISRAMQGAYGGPELLRQYQVKQLMAPFQAMGMQMPMMAEQRRQQLLQDLEADMQKRQQMEATDEERRRQADLQKSHTPEENIRNQIYAPPGAPGWFTQQGPHPLQMLMPGMQGGVSTIQGPQMPGQPQFHPYDPAQVGAYYGARDPQKPAQAGYLGAKTAEQTQETQAGMPTAKVGAEKSKAGELDARATRERAQANLPGGHYQAARQEQFDKEYNDVEKHVQDQLTRIDQLIASKGISPEEGAREKQAWQNYLATAKENIDRKMGKPGQSAREANKPKGSPTSTDLPKQMAPGAQVNAPPTGQGSSGLPAGYEFNDQGIPVPIQPHQ